MPESGGSLNGQPLPAEVALARKARFLSLHRLILVVLALISTLALASAAAADPPVPIDASLDVSNLGARPRITWYSTNAALRAIVERTGPNDAYWNAQGDSIAVNRSGCLIYFESEFLVPGARYGYRLAWNEADGVHRGAETWVDIPGARLAIVGFADSRSPATGPNVVFDLASGEDVFVDLFDVTGRRVAATSYAHTAGRHALRLHTYGPINPGVYVIRLRQGGQTVTKKGILFHWR